MEDISPTIAVLYQLLDSKFVSSCGDGAKRKDDSKGTCKGHWKDKKKKKKGNKHHYKTNDIGSSKSEQGEGGNASSGYFIHGGPHCAKNYLTHEIMNTIKEKEIR